MQSVHLSSDFLPLLLALVAALMGLLFLARRRLLPADRSRLVERVAELEALGQAGRALVEAQLDPDALYEFIFEQISTIIDTSIFQLGLFEDGCYRIVIWVRDGERCPPAEFDLGEGEGLVGWVAQHKQPLLIRNFQSEWQDLPARPRYISEHPPSSAIFIPLVTGGQCVGAMAAQSYQTGAFSQDDVRRLSIVANQAASAIANARLYQQAQSRAAQLELVGSVSRQVRAITPLPDLFAQTVSLIQQTFGYYCVNIYSYDASTDQAALQASTSADVWESHQQLPADGGLINWAVDHRKTVLVNDVSADARFLFLSALPNTRSEMVVPLLIEDHALGVLDLQSDRPNAFGSEDQFALEALADQIALAIQESRLYNAERHQRSVAETLREVAETITSSLDLETVLHAILTDLRRVLPYDAASVLLLEREDTVVVQAAQGLPSVVGTQGEEFCLADSERLSQLAEVNHPIVFHCEDGAGCYHALLDLPPEHACLGAPLIARGELIGFITVDALPPQTYGREDVAVIAMFAGQAAVAIDNARLFASQKEEAWVSGALLQMAEATARSTELEQVIDTIVRMTVSLVGVGQCGILLWQDEPAAFRGTQLAGKGAELTNEFAHIWLPLNTWAPLDALKVRPQPLLLGGGEALSALPDELFDFFGLDNWLLLLPLVAKGELMGVMLASGDTADVDLIRRRVHLVGGIASQAAMAIENARLYAAQQEEAYVTIALLQVAEAVNSLTNLTDILDTIVRLAPILAGVDRCAIVIRQGYQVWDCGPHYGFGTEECVLMEQSLSHDSIVDFLTAMEEGNGPLGAGPGYPLPLPVAWQELLAADGLLALPLVTRRELVGAILVTFPAQVAPFSSRRQNILTGIAHQASIAIENDQLYGEALERERMERELEVARGIQSSFLPDVRPEHPGWSVDAFWRAARQVGGDFYDFFRLTRSAEESELWGIVVADVADKGVPAALYMALSRTLIRSVGHNRHDPAACLARVNDLLLADSRSDLFVTVIYAVWEPESGRLSYTNAGHNPPLYLRANGAVEVLKQNNIVLGVLPSAPMDTHTIHIRPGEAMILYTDGITDALNQDKDEFGLERLVQVVRENRRLGATGMVEAIRAAVDDFVGQEAQFDDLTLVVIKREPDSDR